MTARAADAVSAGSALEHVVVRTEEAINRFALFTPDESVVVALSGGKDSIVLCLVLRELGVPIVAKPKGVVYDDHHINLLP